MGSKIVWSCSAKLHKDFKPQGRLVLGGVYIVSIPVLSLKVYTCSTFEVKDGEMLDCEEDDHLMLEAYFNCNKYALKAYQKKVRYYCAIFVVSLQR